KWIRNVGEDRLPCQIGFLITARTKEPQTVADDAPAQCSLVRMVNIVERVHLAGEIGLVRPTGVGQVIADRAGEVIAARLGDRTDHAAGEASELRRNASGEDGRLLNGVLDIKR